MGFSLQCTYQALEELGTGKRTPFFTKIQDMFGTLVWDSCPCRTQLGKIYPFMYTLGCIHYEQSISRMIYLPARQFSNENIKILCIFNANTEHCVQSTQCMHLFYYVRLWSQRGTYGINVLGWYSETGFHICMDRNFVCFAKSSYWSLPFCADLLIYEINYRGFK
jgi:hypothetical protein